MIIIMRWRRWRYQLIALLGIKLLLPSVSWFPLASRVCNSRWSLFSVVQPVLVMQSSPLGPPYANRNPLPSQLRKENKKWLWTRQGNRLRWIYVQKPITIMRRVHRDNKFSSFFFLPLVPPNVPRRPLGGTTARREVAKFLSLHVLYFRRGTRRLRRPPSSSRLFARFISFLASKLSEIYILVIQLEHVISLRRYYVDNDGGMSESLYSR